MKCISSPLWFCAACGLQLHNGRAWLAHQEQEKTGALYAQNWKRRVKRMAENAGISEDEASLRLSRTAS